MPAAIVDVLTIAQMSLAIGRGSVVHAALIPGGLSDRFLEEAERLCRYRLSVMKPSQKPPLGRPMIFLNFLAEG